MYLLFLLSIIGMIGFFWIILRKQREQAGIQGWVKDQDLDGRGKRFYRDKQTGVICRPDIVERNRVVEVKSATIMGNKPRWGDMLQLGLQMQATGSKEGELRYGQGQKFNFNKDNKHIKAATRIAGLIVNRMRWHLMMGIAPGATPTKNRCTACTFGGNCPKSMR